MVSGAGCKQSLECLPSAAKWFPSGWRPERWRECWEPRRAALSPWQPTAWPLMSSRCLSKSINFYIMSSLLQFLHILAAFPPGARLHWCNVPARGVGNGISFYFCSVYNCAGGTAKGWLELLLSVSVKLLLPSLFQSELVQFRPTL